MKQEKLIFGLQTIQVILDNYPETIMTIYYKPSTKNKRVHDLVSLANKLKIPVAPINDSSSSAGKAHQPIMAECKSIPMLLETDLEVLADTDEKVTFLIFDGISDPHNFGAILRTSAAMGITAVITPKNNSVGLTPAVRNVACGGAEIVPYIRVSNLARTMRMLKEKNVWLYGADANAKANLTAVKFPAKIGLVFGREHDGLKRLTKDECDEIVKIQLGYAMDSLNVSVAVGMFVYEANRR